MAEQRLEFADHLMGMMFDPKHHCKYCEEEQAGNRTYRTLLRTIKKNSPIPLTKGVIICQGYIMIRSNKNIARNGHRGCTCCVPRESAKIIRKRENNAWKKEWK